MRMIRHPPAYVPIDMASPLSPTTQSGMSVPWEGRLPEAIRARTTTPETLAASCMPCPKAMAAAETVCAERKPRADEGRSR